MKRLYENDHTYAYNVVFLIVLLNVHMNAKIGMPIQMTAHPRADN
ncbi:hypothetical protein V3Q90_08415 [Flavobacterium oreochromis]